MNRLYFTLVFYLLGYTPVGALRSSIIKIFAALHVILKWSVSKSKMYRQYLFSNFTITTWINKS